MRNYKPILSVSILKEPTISHNYGYPMMWDFQDTAIAIDRVCTKIMCKL